MCGLVNAWPPIIFFPGEDPEALKSRFIELCAKYNNTYSSYEVAVYVFKDLREPNMRAMQAADYWGKDLEVVEAIRQRILLGGNDEQEVPKSSLIQVAWQVAQDMRESAKDRLAAVELIAKVQGQVPKQIEMKDTSPDRGGLPIFEIRRRSDYIVAEETATDE